MNTGRISRQALEYRLGRKRLKGWPRYGWEEQVKKNVEKGEITWMEMMEKEIWND